MRQDIKDLAELCVSVINLKHEAGLSARAYAANILNEIMKREHDKAMNWTEEGYCMKSRDRNMGDIMLDDKR